MIADTTTEVREAPTANPAQTLANAGHADDHSEGVPTNLRRPHTLTVIGVVILFVLLLGGLFLIGWYPRQRAEAIAQQDAQEKISDRPIVSVVHPIESTPTRRWESPCDVRAMQETDIYSRANGFLKKLYVDIHDHVQAGQLLAEIDTPDVDASLAQAKASVSQAQANVAKANADVDLAQRTLDRYKGVQNAGSGNVTQQEVDEKETAVEQAQATVQQAQANVLAAQENVRRLTVLQGFEKVTAPFSGTITARNYDVGALLSPSDAGPGKAIFHIAQTDPLRVFVSVPQVYSTSVKMGSPATLSVRNYPGRTFAGTVSRTSSSLDLRTRTMMYELHFPNPKEELVPGMYGEVSLQISNPHRLLVIPTSALVFDASGSRAAVVEDGKIHFKNISVGNDLGMQLEITDGLSSTDEVVATPNEQLTEGTSVDVLKPHADATAGAVPAAAVPTKRVALDRP